MSDANQGSSATAQNAVTTGKEGAPNPEPTEPQNPFAGTKHKVKVNGEEREVDYDELVKNYQFRSVSHQKLEEANKTKAEVQAEKRAIIEFARKNPAEFLKRTGIDPRDFSERYLSDLIEREQANPEQRRAMELEEENRRLRQAEERRRAEESEKQSKAQVETLVRQFETNVAKAFKKAGIEPTKAHIAKYVPEAARYNVAYYEAEGRHLSPDELVDVLREIDGEHERSYHSRFDQMDGEALAKALGEKNIAKIREYDLKRIKETEPAFLKAQPKAKSPSPPQNGGAKPAFKGGFAAWRAELDKKQGLRS